MKVFDRRVKEALLEKKPVVNQQEAWEEIAASLDNRSKNKRLILSLFLLACLTVAGWTLYSHWDVQENGGEAAVISQSMDSSFQIETEEMIPSVALAKTEKPILSLKGLDKIRSLDKQRIPDNKASKGNLAISQELIQAQPTNAHTITHLPSPRMKPVAHLPSTNMEKMMEPSESPQIPTASMTPPDKNKRSWPSFVFTYGRGMVPSSSSFSDLSLGEFASTTPQPSQLYGLELQFQVSPSWDFRTGFLSHSRRYRVDLTNGGNGIYWQYNNAIPLMLQYNVRGRRFQPYVAFGLHVNLWYDIGGTSAQFNTLTGLGYLVKIRKGSPLTPVLEVGSAFWLFKQKFSLAAEANLGFKQTFDTGFGIIEDRQLTQTYGQARSNGSYLALKLKYHLDVPLLLASIRDARSNSPSTSALSDQVGRKNEVGLEALGVGVYYSLYYQRFLLQKKGFRLGIKPGIGYIPTFEEQGAISGPPDDIKPMGLYVPLSVIAYIGKPAFSLQLGLGHVIHYGPLRYPIPNGRLYDTEMGQFLITGIRGEYKRFSYHGQFNIGFDFEEPTPSVVAAFGFGIGYLF